MYDAIAAATGGLFVFFQCSSATFGRESNNENELSYSTGGITALNQKERKFTAVGISAV